MHRAPRRPRMCPQPAGRSVPSTVLAVDTKFKLVKGRDGYNYFGFFQFVKISLCPTKKYVLNLIIFCLLTQTLKYIIFQL